MSNVSKPSLAQNLLSTPQKAAFRKQFPPTPLPEVLRTPSTYTDPVGVPAFLRRKQPLPAQVDSHVVTGHEEDYFTEHRAEKRRSGEDERSGGDEYSVEGVKGMDGAHDQDNSIYSRLAEALKHSPQAEAISIYAFTPAPFNASTHINGETEKLPFRTHLANLLLSCGTLFLTIGGIYYTELASITRHYYNLLVANLRARHLLNDNIHFALYVAQVISSVILCVVVAGWLVPVLMVIIPLVLVVVGAEEVVGGDWWIGKKVRELWGLVKEWAEGKGGVDDGRGGLDGASDAKEERRLGNPRLVISDRGVRVMRG